MRGPLDPVDEPLNVVEVDPGPDPEVARHDAEWGWLLFHRRVQASPKCLVHYALEGLPGAADLRPHLGYYVVFERQRGSPTHITNPIINAS
ncbi:hypothetical protein BH20ACT24_BH20ACT24_06030 [soil metagenome]